MLTKAAHVASPSASSCPKGVHVNHWIILSLYFQLIDSITLLLLLVKLVSMFRAICSQGIIVDY